MNRPPEIVRGSQLEHPHFAGVQVDLNFCYISAPRIDRIGIAGIGFVVPVDTRRVGVPDEGPQSAMLGSVFASYFGELVQEIAGCQESAVDQFYFWSAMPFGNEAQQLMFHLAGR